MLMDFSSSSSRSCHRLSSSIRLLEKRKQRRRLFLIENNLEVITNIKKTDMPRSFDLYFVKEQLGEHYLQNAFNVNQEFCCRG